MLQGQEDIGGVKLGSVLLEATYLTQVEEELAAWAILKAEVKLAFSLEGVVHLHDKAVVDAFLRISKGGEG